MNNPDDEHQVEADILLATTALREQFPVAYQLLSETPLFLRVQDSRIRIHDFRDYLETIQLQLSDLIVEGSIRKARPV